VTGRAEIMDAVHVGGLGGTYGGNPPACAAALAVFETIFDEGLLDRATAIESLVTDRLRRLQARDPRVGDVRGRGAMVAAELVEPGSRVPDPALARAVATQAHQRGVIVLTCGTYGNVLRFLPPLVIGEPELTRGLEILERALHRPT
jgi:4-aminobutyrate aminotransferase/(S)-3-amino-2-methylpropionate transaminase